MPLFGEIVVIKRNGTDGTHFPLTATTCLFGRKSECDIRIQLPHVSKEHCRVEVKANKEVFVINLSTVNPTQLNGIAVQQPEVLKHGDVITIIDRSFRFEQPQTNPRSQSTGGNSLSSKLVEDEQPSIKGKASKLTRKSEGNVSRTTHSRLSLPISPHRRSSREKRDLSPFGELYEMLKSKELNLEHAKTPAKLNMENGDHISTPVTTRRSVGNAKETQELSIGELQFEGQELHVESATLSEKTASALKSPSRGRQSTLSKQEQQRLSGKRVSPAKSELLLKDTASFQDNGQKQTNDKLTPNRRRSTSNEPAQDVQMTPGKSGGSVSPRSRNMSPKSASPKGLHKNVKGSAKVSNPRQKRRSSELDLPEPTPKRKRVSFGGHLSPELFDKRLPPNSPLKRGATPARRSLSLVTPLALMRKSFGGFRQTAIKETFEPGTDLALFKGSPAKKSPSKRSPAKGASPAKRSPAKGASPAKRSPAKGASPAKRSPAKGASPAKRSPAKGASPAKRSPAKGASPAKRSPAKGASPAKRSPAKVATPAKRSPAKVATPAKRSPAKAASPAKRSPAKAATPAKRSPAKGASPARRSPAKAATPARRSPAKAATPARRSPAKAATPAKRSPAKGASPAKRSPAKAASPARRSPAKAATPARRSPAKAATPARRSPAKAATPARRSPAKAATPARRSPAKAATPAKRSPAKAATPAKRSPAKAATPAKRSPAKRSPAKAATPAKRSPAKAATPAKRSPAKAATPAKRSPAKAATPAKRSPVKAATPAKRSPASATPAKRSPASTYTKGRFSISRIDTPPQIDVHAPNTEKNELSAQTPRKSRKSISLKKTPGRRSRKLESFEILRSRRRSGATEANLLVAKSWADVVRSGVPKNQKKSEKHARKAVPTKRKPKPKTPARRIIDRIGTGHADSPATILVGRAHTRTVDLTGYVPKIVQNQAIKITNDQNESFTGLSELFNTPAHVKPRRSGRSGGLPMETPQSIIVDMSLMKTPEELGEMVVSPINGSPATTQKKQYSRDAVSRLLSPVTPASEEQISEASKDTQLVVKETATLNETRFIKKGAKAQMKKRGTMGLTGVKRIMRTPKQKGKQVIDPVALKKMLRTPKQVESLPVESSGPNDLVGLKEIMKTPKVKGQPVEDMTGIARIMKTPRRKQQPVEDMAGIKRIMKTPKQKGTPVEDMTGIKRIMTTPKEKGQPVEDMVGIKRIMTTPKEKGQPVEDMVGIKRIMRTPKEKGQPVEDMEGLSQIMRTPTENTHPIEEIFGMKQLIKTPPKRALGVREGTSGTPSQSGKKATLFQTNQKSAQEEALPKLTLEKNNESEVAVQTDRETEKSKPTPKRGRPAKASVKLASDGGKPVDNGTSTHETHPEESSREASLQVLASDDKSSTAADKATPAKRRGRPSKSSLSGSPGGGNSVENNTFRHEKNPEEAAPLQVLSTENTSSLGDDKATPAKRGRPCKRGMSKSPASSNKDKSVEKNSTPEHEKNLEESNEGTSLQVQTIEDASSTSADKATPAKRRGRPAKRSLSHSPGLEKPVVDVPEDLSTSNEVSNIPEGSSHINTDQENNVDLPMEKESEPLNLNIGAKKVTKKSQRKKVTEESVQIAVENLVVEQDDEKSAPQRRRGRPQRGGLSSTTEVLDEALPEEPPTNRRTGRGRKIAEVAKPQQVSTSVEESQEVRNEELSATKTQTKSTRHQKAVSEDSTVTATKKPRGRQPKVDREQKAAEEENTVEKSLTELPGDSALVNNVTPSVRRGRRARGNANAVTETVVTEANLPDLTNNIVLHKEQESSSQASPEAKTQRGKRKNLKNTNVDSVSNSAETDVATLELEERPNKRSTRGVRGTQQVDELKEPKGKKAKVEHVPKPAELVHIQENLAKENASRAKSVQWHPLLTVKGTPEKNTEETVKNLADEEAPVSAVKSRGRRRQEVKESVPAKRSRSRREENNAEALTSSSTTADAVPIALVASESTETPKNKRGRRKANTQLEKVTDSDLSVTEVSSKLDLVPEVVNEKAVNKRNTGKRNLKSSSDSDSSSKAVEPVLETITQKRGRRGAAAKSLDSETTEVKTVESAENVTSNKRRGRAPSQKTNNPETSKTTTEPVNKNQATEAVAKNTDNAESPPKSRRGLKRKAATTDVPEGNTSVSENGPRANVRESTRGASRQKTAAKENPVVVEESPAKKKRTEPSSSPAQKGGKTRATAAKRKNEKPTEVVKTRQTLRTRK
ncbi:proliferation marker protein Ki-67 isoform X3 [Xenopus tropicalis]|uniref:Proliferation marker protein Ki-67 isoform X3 n=1 Tax=Xenopus tropicalis TaxID=8364 RepID=A0A8J1JV37_XENTR|nr:proliferation marker protein Ki-67 isoform X3 [Xenopus tropicalis]